MPLLLLLFLVLRKPAGVLPVQFISGAGTCRSYYLRSLVLRLLALVVPDVQRQLLDLRLQLRLLLRHLVRPAVRQLREELALAAEVPNTEVEPADRLLAQPAAHLPRHAVQTVLTKRTRSGESSPAPRSSSCTPGSSQSSRCLASRFHYLVSALSHACCLKSAFTASAWL